MGTRLSFYTKARDEAIILPEQIPAGADMMKDTVPK